MNALRIGFLGFGEVGQFDERKGMSACQVVANRRRAEHGKEGGQPDTCIEGAQMSIQLLEMQSQPQIVRLPIGTLGASREVH